MTYTYAACSSNHAPKNQPISTRRRRTVDKKQQEKHVCVRRHTPTGISLRQLVRRRRVKWRLQFVAKQQQPQQHYPPVWRQACLPARFSSDAAPTSHKSVAITVLPGFYHTRVSYC